MNMPDIKPGKYLRYLVLPSLFGTQRTKEILLVNPTLVPHREEAQEVSIFVFDYNSESLEEKQCATVGEILPYKQNDRITWINIDGLRKADVETVCTHFGIHPLLMEYYLLKVWFQFGISDLFYVKQIQYEYVGQLLRLELHE